MTLLEAKKNREYKIIRVNIAEKGIDSYLFRLGCYKGKPITVVNNMGSNKIVVIKDARYSFNSEICKSIEIE